MREIYLDNAATTKTAMAVVRVMNFYATHAYANPSSKHSLGKHASEALLQARTTIAKKMGASPSEIVFTSGGTEANNLALQGTAHAHGKGHIITSAIEHPSVLETCKHLEKAGFSVTYLPVSKEGLISVAAFKKTIQKDTFLVSIMHVNNELGTIQPIEAIAQHCKKNGILFHTDAVQAFCKVPFSLQKTPADLISFSAHKIHGPKGVGALFVRKGTSPSPLLFGGMQEQGLRAGTQNLPGSIGFAEAVPLWNAQGLLHIKRLQSFFLRELRKLPGVHINGSITHRVCTNIHCSFDSIYAEDLLMHLERDKIFASTGAACNALARKPSHVLKAIGLSDEEIRSSVRFSLSINTTKQELVFVLKKLRSLLHSLRAVSAYYSQTI